jgi:Alpha galactosidase A/Alpha galactosidase C-terminal beta sandwich domain
MGQWIQALTASLVVVALSAAAATSNAQQNAATTTNGLEPTPVLGWSSWSFLRKEPTADKIEAQARAMRDSGLQKLGYTYVNLDDFWYQCPGPQGPNVDSYGRWVTDPSRFPPRGDTDGIKVVAGYMHSMGMKLGIYVTPGISRQAVRKKTSIEGTPYTAAQIVNSAVMESNYNCKGMVRIDYRKPGAQEFIDSWVKMLSQWDIDYIKIDGMGNDNAPDVEAWSKAIRKSGRPIVLDVTQGSFTAALAPTLMKYADQWEFAPDIECYRCEKGSSSYPLTSWKDVSNRFNFVADWQPYSGSGRFNDYDSIEIGNGSNNGITPVERQMQLSLWALGAAPLILGVDLTNLDQEDLQKYLKNAAVLAVDQDSIAAKRVVNNGHQQVFAKIEANGDAIVGLFNTGETERKISVAASAVGLPENKSGYSTDNLWTGETKKANGDIDALVPPHGVVLYRVKAL